MRRVLTSMFVCCSSISAFAGETTPAITDFAFEGGVKYAYLKNKMRYASQYNGYPRISGFTSATLGWNDLISKGVELSAKFTHNPTSIFANVSLLAGWNSDRSGNMRDIDFISSSGVTIFDTVSATKINHNYAVHFDVGRTYLIGTASLSPSLGYYYADTKMDAYGGTALPVGNNTLYNNIGIAPGFSIASSININTEQSIVHAPRFSVGLHQPLTDSISLIIEPAYMPLAKITFNDWHRISSDKMQDGIPNLIAKNKGWGYSLDADLNYKYSQSISFSMGLKYTKFAMGEANALNRMVVGNNIQTNGTKSVDFETLGLLMGAKYKF